MPGPVAQAPTTTPEDQALLDEAKNKLSDADYNDLVTRRSSALARNRPFDLRGQIDVLLKEAQQGTPQQDAAIAMLKSILASTSTDFRNYAVDKLAANFAVPGAHKSEEEARAKQFLNRQGVGAFVAALQADYQHQMNQTLTNRWNEYFNQKIAIFTGFKRNSVDVNEKVAYGKMIDALDEAKSSGLVTFLTSALGTFGLDKMRAETMGVEAWVKDNWKSINAEAKAFLDAGGMKTAAQSVNNEMGGLFDQDFADALTKQRAIDNLSDTLDKMENDLSDEVDARDRYDADATAQLTSMRNAVRRKKKALIEDFAPVAGQIDPNQYLDATLAPELARTFMHHPIGANVDFSTVTSAISGLSAAIAQGQGERVKAQADVKAAEEKAKVAQQQQDYATKFQVLAREASKKPDFDLTAALAALNANPKADVADILEEERKKAVGLIGAETAKRAGEFFGTPRTTKIGEEEVPFTPQNVLERLSPGAAGRFASLFAPTLAPQAGVIQPIVGNITQQKILDALGIKSGATEGPHFQAQDVLRQIYQQEGIDGTGIVDPAQLARVGGRLSQTLFDAGEMQRRELAQGQAEAGAAFVRAHAPPEAEKKRVVSIRPRIKP